MNPLFEYDNYLKEGHEASLGEWKDWAKRIVTSFKAELKAASNDHKRYKALEATNAELLEALVLAKYYIDTLEEDDADEIIAMCDLIDEAIQKAKA